MGAQLTGSGRPRGTDRLCNSIEPNDNDMIYLETQNNGDSYARNSPARTTGVT